MAKAEGMRDKCRHCGRPLVFWKPDEKIERFGTMSYRSDKPRWWHLDPDVTAFNAGQNVYQDSKFEYLGAWCPQKPDEGTMHGQPGEPVGYCVVLKGGERLAVCNNPVTDPDLFMCGVHARKERERQRIIEERRARREGDEAIQVGMEEVCRRILDNWGLHVGISGYYGSKGGKVEVSHVELETLLETFAEEYKSLQNKGKRGRSRAKNEG